VTKKKKKKPKQIPVPEPHPCNTRISRDRDQEDCGSKPAYAKLFTRPYLKRTDKKKIARGLPQVVREHA
jgi:hypothetical protein